MKNIIWIIGISVLLSSCSLFEKPDMTQEEIDSLVKENKELKETIKQKDAEVARYKLIAQQAASTSQSEEAEQATATGSDGKYMVVAGSFKVRKNAEAFARKIQAEGGTGSIIQGPGNFEFVIYNAHAGLSDAISEMEKIRRSTAADAWVYMQR